ncbi:MAG: universal stress protein [Desulfobacter sp.]|nr:MAG: universal stress protein [Desulfobacter sp.]
MTELKKKKILLAYDGSDLALDSVRYIGEVFPHDRAEVVIFYVESKIPRSFWRMEREHDFRFQTPEIRASMAQGKKTVKLAMEKAEQILSDSGFPKEAVHTKIHIKSQGMVQDIVEESHQGYDALVIGRRGHSRIKDFLVDTLPMKLLGKIKSIPLIVVGKNPDHKNILVAFDGTREIIKAVKSMSELISTGESKLLLCHSQHRKRLIGRCGKKPETRMFDLSMDYFLEAGFSSDQISFEIMQNEKNPTHCILNKARYGNYGTIVVGRRGLTPLKRLMFNRVGNKIFRNADNHVVWIVQ